jgi:uncharacterized Zn finger protein (UPF0148 family)
MPGTFNCPSCGAPLEHPGNADTVPCPYCRNSVIVPAELRSKTSRRRAPAGLGKDALTPEQLAEVKRHLSEGQKIEAIKVYRQATLAGLKEAKDAVEAIEASDPELKDRPRTASLSNRSSQVKTRIAVILVGLFFLGIASIFPLVFFPMGIQAWQAGEHGGAIVAFFGAVVWAVIWGGIGGFILFSKD